MRRNAEIYSLYLVGDEKQTHALHDALAFVFSPGSGSKKCLANSVYVFSDGSGSKKIECLLNQKIWIKHDKIEEAFA